MPKTSKKTYELVAGALHDALQQWGQDPVPADTLIRDVAKAIARAFAEKGGDPQFSLERFLALVETGTGRP